MIRWIQIEDTGELCWCEQINGGKRLVKEVMLDFGVTSETEGKTAPVQVSKQVSRT